MGVLYVTLNVNAVSEPWVDRLLLALEPDVAFVAAPNPRRGCWNGHVPTINVKDTSPRLWRRVARRLGLAIAQRPARTGVSAVLRAVRSPRVSRIYVHYLDFALRFEEAWASTSKPLFIHCHGCDMTWDLRHAEAPWEPVHAPDYVASVRRIARRAILIANSQTSAGWLKAIGIPEDRVVVKHTYVPVPGALPRRDKVSRGLTVLYLGRLIDCKGPDLAIRAFEIACDRGLDGYLLMAGDGPLRLTCELLRARSRWADRIKLLGPVDWDTGQQLREKADIFTAHSCRGPITHQQEAFGAAFAEALACGLPVVSARSGALPEVVIDGVTGFLVEPGDVEGHADRLLELADDPDLRRRMGEAGWRDAKERFSLEKERPHLRAILGLGD